MSCTFQSTEAPGAPEEVLASLSWLLDQARFVQKLFSTIKLVCLRGMVLNTLTLGLQCGRMEVASSILVSPIGLFDII